MSGNTHGSGKVRAEKCLLGSEVTLMTAGSVRSGYSMASVEVGA